MVAITRSVSAILLAAASLAGCASLPSASQGMVSDACQILNDSYAQFRPAADKVNDPRGYWDETVLAQSGYVSRMEKLKAQDLLEEKLLGDYLQVNQEMLTISLKQQGLVRIGETAYEFQHRMTKAEFDSWQADGKEFQALYKRITDTWTAYANYCAGH